MPLDLTHSTYADHVVMSTADIAFIAAGAFSGFQQIAHRRAMRDRIGFGRDQSRRAPADPDAIAVDFTAEQVENIANFQAYGFLPELVARFTRVVPFRALDAGDAQGHPAHQRHRAADARVRGRGLRARRSTRPCSTTSSRDALRRETGARGLASTLTRHLEDVAFEAFAEHPGGDVRLDLEAASSASKSADSDAMRARAASRVDRACSSVGPPVATPRGA